MESLPKNLVQIITNKCKERQIAASNDFVSFLLELLLQNNDYFDDENNVNIAKIIEAITKLLVYRCKPRLVSLKIQFYFVRNHQEREERIKKYRKRLRHKTEPLIKEICEVKKLTSERESQKLYQKMLVVMTLLSGSGKPTEMDVLREVELSLQSVYLPSELPFFVDLSNREKEEQLIELTCIVTGIRLFNKDCQRGGEGIDDLPNILQEAVMKAENYILSVLEELMQKIYKYTSMVEKLLEGSTKNHWEFAAEERVSWGVEMLAAYRQQEVYIRTLLNDVETSKIQIQHLLNRLRNQFVKLHQSCRFRTAIPTSQVYPQFVSLADTWLKLQDEVMILSHVNSFLSQLQTLCVTINAYDDPVIDQILGETEVQTDAERLERSMGNLINECGDCEVLYPNTTENFDKIHLEYIGFCAWTFVARKGFLVPGNPNIGIVKWKGKHFAFSSPEFARKFGQDPSGYLLEASYFVRKNPEYIHLFQIYEDMRGRLPNGKDSRLHDQGIQTEKYKQLPENFNDDFSWSVSKHGKKALKSIKFSQRGTKSTQTIDSQFRSVAQTQAEPPKNKQVQTRKDGSTNTEIMLNFITSLRQKKR